MEMILLILKNYSQVQFMKEDILIKRQSSSNFLKII
jgi:hypothetical protein